MRLPLPALLTAMLGCDTAPVELLFSRQAPDPASHVFPTDTYRSDSGLDRFTETQLSNLPFLRQLQPVAAWAPTTALRIPFTPAFDDPDQWVNPTSITDALTVYRLTPLEAVPLGEVRLEPHVNAVTLWPRAPWAPGRYAVLVRNGPRTRGGTPITASPDQREVMNQGDPTTDAAFAAVDRVDPIAGRGDTLAFWTFTVADATSDVAWLKAYVEGLAPVDRAGTDAVVALSPLMPAEGRGLAVGGARNLAEGDEAISALFAAVGADALPHDAIGRVVAGAISTPVFISDPRPDPSALATSQTFVARDPSRPFSADNPLSLSTSTPTRLLPYLMAIPKVHAPDLPVIIALHGISRSKTDWIAFANAACAAGHAIIGIDLYQHGDRQADIEVPEGGFTARLDPVLEAAGIAFPDPFFNPTFLARTRDKLRQSLVDHLALLRLLRAGDGENPLIDFDGDGLPDAHGPLRLIGHSLGAMLATAIVATSPEIDRAVLSAPGAHLAQLVTDSPRLGKDIDLLIYATANAPGFGLLAGSAARLVPGSAARALHTQVAETLLAPADPAPFASALVDGRLGASARVLVQLPATDDVVPTSAQRRFALAFAEAASADREVTLVGDDHLDLDLEPSMTPGPLTLAPLSGGHGVLLDFVDPTATAFAQRQAATFLAAP
jgi:alpha-beta hydrolase superfamily lysophospholipase